MKSKFLIIPNDLFDNIMSYMDWTIDRGDFKKLVLVCSRFTNRLHKIILFAKNFVPNIENCLCIKMNIDSIYKNRRLSIILKPSIQDFIQRLYCYRAYIENDVEYIDVHYLRQYIITAPINDSQRRYLLYSSLPSKDRYTYIDLSDCKLDLITCGTSCHCFKFANTIIKKIYSGIDCQVDIQFLFCEVLRKISTPIEFIDSLWYVLHLLKYNYNYVAQAIPLFDDILIMFSKHGEFEVIARLLDIVVRFPVPCPIRWAENYAKRTDKHTFFLTIQDLQGYDRPYYWYNTILSVAVGVWESEKRL